MLEMDYVDLSKRPWHILNVGDDPKLFVPFFFAEQMLWMKAPRHLLNDQLEYAKQYSQKGFSKGWVSVWICCSTMEASSGSPSLHAVFCCQVHQWLSSAWCPLADATQYQMHVDALLFLGAAQTKRAAKQNYMIRKQHHNSRMSYLG